MDQAKQKQPSAPLFLPDFCALPVTLGVVLLAELFAVILTLAPFKSGDDFWADLAITSLFMQWVALSGSAGLCFLRRRLPGLGSVAAALIAYLLLVMLVGVFSDLAYRLAHLQGVWTGPAAWEFLLRNLVIGAIVSGLALRYLYLQHQSQQRLRAEAEARIQALQARIRPHFLFNSMNTLASLTRSDPALAEAGIEDLSDLFRASLGDARRLIPFAEEVALARRYLHMEQLRLGERLRVEWQVDDVPEQLALPALTLQPLLENAVYHGIEPLPDGGTVRVTGRRDGARVLLMLENPRPITGASQGTGHQLALDNIRERLRAHFGERARLLVEALPDRYRITLSLPHGSHNQ